MNNEYKLQNQLMNISRESTGELTATVRIEVLKEDYEEKVLKQLKDFQHKANIPGFRPGHVPVGLIRKMYGKAIVAEEVEKIISESLAQYLQDEKLDVLGNPMPNIEKSHQYTFETEKDFEFFFDIGVAPDIKIDLAELPAVPRYTITVDDVMLDRYIDDMRRKNGNSIHPESATEEDMVTGEILELGPDGQPVENGIKKMAFIRISDLTMEESKQRLTGITKNEKLVIVPATFFEGTHEAVKVLGITDKDAEKETISFEFTVADIYHIEPAPLDEAFYKKVYPELELISEEDFREQVRKDASGSFIRETDNLFYRNVSDSLVKDVPLDLPDAFLKRWLLEHKENKLSPEEIEKEYGSFSDSMKWQLIENKLLRENQIKVEEAEIRAYIKNYFQQQIPMMPDDPESEKRFESLVDTVMKNTEQVRKINDELYTAKLLEVFKSKLNIEEKEISYEEFITLASATHAHDHEHDHDHDHDHDHKHDHEHEHEHEH